MSMDFISWSCIEHQTAAANLAFPPVVLCPSLGYQGTTVRSVLPEILPDVAVIVDVPDDFSAASPGDPRILIVATDVLDELQLTDAVKSKIEVSVNKPIAWNWNC